MRREAQGFGQKGRGAESSPWGNIPFSRTAYLEPVQYVWRPLLLPVLPRSPRGLSVRSRARRAAWHDDLSDLALTRETLREPGSRSWLVRWITRVPKVFMPLVHRPAAAVPPGGTEQYFRHCDCQCQVSPPSCHLAVSSGVFRPRGVTLLRPTSRHFTSTKVLVRLRIAPATAAETSGSCPAAGPFRSWAAVSCQGTVLSHHS